MRKADGLTTGRNVGGEGSLSGVKGTSSESEGIGNRSIQVVGGFDGISRCGIAQLG